MAKEWNEMKKYKAFNEWKTCGQPMKPFIDECGIIHIAYMATAMFYQKKWLPLVSNFIRVRSFSFIFFRVLKSVSNVVFRHPRKRVGGRSHAIRSPSQMTSSPAINCEHGCGMTSYFPLPTLLERIRLRISSLYAWFCLFFFFFFFF